MSRFIKRALSDFSRVCLQRSQVETQSRGITSFDHEWVLGAYAKRCGNQFQSRARDQALTRYNAAIDIANSSRRLYSSQHDAKAATA